MTINANITAGGGAYRGLDVDTNSPMGEKQGDG